jgi:hypothetical protein
LLLVKVLLNVVFAEPPLYTPVVRLLVNAAVKVVVPAPPFNVPVLVTAPVIVVVPPKVTVAPFALPKVLLTLFVPLPKVRLPGELLVITVKPMLPAVDFDMVPLLVKVPPSVKVPVPPRVIVPVFVKPLVLEKVTALLPLCMIVPEFDDCPATVMVPASVISAAFVNLPFVVVKLNVDPAAIANVPSSEIGPA